MHVTDLLLHSGRSAVEIAFFTLLPIMVVVLCLIRVLEAVGVMGWLMRLLTPVAAIFGLTALALMAVVQTSLVSFAAPVAILAMMELAGATRRQLAAALAAVLCMAQANVVFPMATIGLRVGFTMAVAWLASLLAAALAYYVFCRAMDEPSISQAAPLPQPPSGLLVVVQQAGAEAFRLAVGTIPLLALAFLLVAVVQAVGLVDALQQGLQPLLLALQVPPEMVLLALTKFLGGGTAYFGVALEAQAAGLVDAQHLNAYAGLLVHAFDLPGIAMLAAAGPRTASVWRVAALGAMVGIALRTALHLGWA